MTPPAADAHTVYFHFWALSRAVRASAAEALAGLGISLDDFGLLTIMADSGPLSMTMLSRRAHLGQSTLTMTAQKLMRQGWCEQERSPTDARKKLIRVTPLGEELLRTGCDEMRRREAEILSAARTSRASVVERTEALRAMFPAMADPAEGSATAR